MNEFEAMSDPYYYDIYDPFYESPQAYIPVMQGGEMGSLSQASYAPEPDWLTQAWQPMEDFGHTLWEGGGELIKYGFEKAPELLYGYGLSKIRKVDEGAGVTVIHSQAPRPGGAPAQPIEKIIPGQFPFFTPMAGAPPQAVGTGTMILIGAGLIVLYILSR